MSLSPSSSAPSSPGGRREHDLAVMEFDMSESESLFMHMEDDGLPPLEFSRSSSSASSSFESNTTSSTSPSAAGPSTFTQRLRQRVSNVLQAGAPPVPESSSSSPRFNSSLPVQESRLSFLMGGPHAFEQNIPFPPGPVPVRKGSDYEKLANHQYGKTEGADVAAASTATRGNELFTIRSREQIVLHFLIELTMLRRDALLLFSGLVFQWLHSVITNLAYLKQAKLTAAQRVPLSDIAFDALPALNGAWWIASEYLVYGMVIAVTVLIASILVVRWNAPHKRPLYCIPILRRMMLTLVVAQALRIVSFMITTLPGPSRQCLYHVPEDMTAQDILAGPAQDRGNPEGWLPPKSMYDVLWRIDATNGCGDLMFSSHTIFTVLFVCVVFRYFNWNFAKYSMVCIQIFAVPFILAAHKHYSVDVFTALYVTPLIFQFIKSRLPDMDITSARMGQHYGVRFYRGLNGGHVVALFGNEFYIATADLPTDLQRQERDEPMKVLTEHNVLESEVDPMIV